MSHMLRLRSFLLPTMQRLLLAFLRVFLRAFLRGLVTLVTLVRTIFSRVNLRRRFFSLRLLIYIYSLILYRFSRAIFLILIRLSKALVVELRKRERFSYGFALALFLSIFIAFGERIVASNLQATIERSGISSALAFRATTYGAMASDSDSANIKLASISGISRLLPIANAKVPNNSLFSSSLRVEIGENSGENSRPQEQRPTRTRHRVIEHAVEGSLYQTAYRHDIPLQLLRRFVDVMSYDVDFQRDIWAGAHFRMLVSQRYELGIGGLWRALEEARLETAELSTGSGKQYRYHRSSATDSFYDETGKPAKRLLRRTPMSGLRLTSRFGARRHPILGYTRMHKGVDFAAPRGTPILAAGDGVVRKRNYSRRGYGRYIVLRHNEHLSTLYAHMRSFSKGVVVGKRVRQGDIIGYVGTSGLSTGPHLHYEIHLDGRAVNPRSVRLPERRALTASARSDFMVERAMQDRLLASGGEPALPSARDRLRGLVWLSAVEQNN